MADNQTGRKLWQMLPGLQTIFTFLLGAFTWRVFSYFRRVWRQPHLTTVGRTNKPDPANPLADQARYVAANDVRGAIEERFLPNGERKQVLCAGWRNFREPWARDFGFASFGLVELQEIRALRETLELFLLTQTDDGQFPVKVHSTNIIDRYLHSLLGRQQPIFKPLRPKYQTAHNTISLDGNALLVIAALNYLRRVEDETFAHTHWEALKRALRWLEMQALEVDGLLHQGAYTDWADSVRRTGCIHYTNVLYWKALHEFARDAEKYGYEEDNLYFAEKADTLKDAINDHFWDQTQGFFITSKQFSHVLSSSGNLLAVAWGLATPQQSQRILDVMESFGMADPVPTQVTNRDYDKEYVAIENRLAGIPHYHSSAAWLWLGAWHVLALVRVNRLQEAGMLLERMRLLIVRDNIVHEVYDQTGRPLSTFWYTSEAPLTWSASLFLHADAMYERAMREAA